MDDRHPGKHPFVLCGITLLCTLLGGLFGHYSPEYGGQGVNMVAGLVFGFAAGLVIAVFWWLMITLADL